MKHFPFTFHFKDGPITVWAFGYEEAEILAKAEAIRRGWSYEIIKPNIEHLNMDIDWNALTEEEQAILHKLLTKAHGAVKEEHK
jgi:hypothetical protein